MQGSCRTHGLEWASNGFVTPVLDGSGFQNRLGCPKDILDRPERLVNVSYRLGVVDGLVRSTQSPSVTVAQHLFGIQNIVVVHHSHCGATSFTADGIIDAYRHEHHLDISSLYQRSSICIADYEASLKHDTTLLRSHDGTPRHVNIFGYFYDIDTGALTEVVRDIHQEAQELVVDCR